MTSNIDPLPANQRREEPTTNDPQAGYEPAEEGKVTHEYELTMKVIDLGAEQREPTVAEWRALVQRLVNDMQLGRSDTGFNTIGDIALWNGIKEAQRVANIVPAVPA